LTAEIHVFRDLAELSRHAADRFVEAAEETVAGRRPFYAAISGGSTPRAMFGLLVTTDLALRFPWTSTQLFQVDERTVPPDHPDSNYRMIRETLLDHAPLPPENFQRMRAESPDLEAAAHDYAHEIAGVLDPRGGAWPRFDLIHLGLGPDGHTASLFPGTVALEEEKRWVVPNHVPMLNTWRLTLTYPVINAAREVIFVVDGENKADVLRRVLYPETPEDRFPAQGIAPREGQLRWYVTESAARLLPRGASGSAG
jgi:6-phosphogluconolactonase